MRGVSQVGRQPGLYGTWKQCADQITAYPGAVFDGFVSREQAESYLAAPCSPESPLKRSRPCDSRPRAPTAAHTTTGSRASIDRAAHELDPELLDQVQRRAVQLAKERRNVFITGVAGTGKTAVIRTIIGNARGQGLQVAVAAPTGVAAENLGADAQTLHSLAGVGVPQV